MPHRVNTPVCSASSCDDHVDVGGDAAAERRGDARQEPHRTKIDVLLQRLAKGQDQLTRGNMVGDSRIADRTQVDGVELPDLVEPVSIHHPSGAEIEVTSPREFRELTAKVSLRCGDFHYFDAGGDDFLSNPVAGNHSYPIRVHVSPSC
jgi:hypothetical protein